MIQSLGYLVMVLSLLCTKVLQNLLLEIPMAGIHFLKSLSYDFILSALISCSEKLHLQSYFGDVMVRNGIFWTIGEQT